MRLHQAVQEFQAVSRELENAQRRKLFRNILKLILIGFFIGKDIENKISQLALKKDEIKESIERQVSVELTLIRSLVGEIQNSGTYLIHADKERCISKLELLEADLTLLGKNGIFKQEFIDTEKDELRKLHQTISNYNKEFVEQRKKRKKVGSFPNILYVHVQRYSP